jgi:hypothetical protein
MLPSAATPFAARQRSCLVEKKQGIVLTPVRVFTPVRARRLPQSATPQFLRVSAKDLVAWPSLRAG